MPSEDGRFLHVYYGLERLEVVPAAADHPAHRMLIARLYNADVKVAVLEELFDLDHKTIRAWGLALDSGDPEALQRMLFGAPRKLTPAIREFIAGRWPQLRAQRCRNHREVLQNEIKAYFGVNFNSINYSKLRDNNLVDCQVSNKLHVQKTKEARQIARRKARLLLAEGTAQRQETARQQEMIQLDRIVSPSRATHAPSTQNTGGENVPILMEF